MTSRTDTSLRPAIAYTRVSTQRQNEEGHGHELQTTRIHEFARLMGYRIVRTFSDAETGMGEESLRKRKGAMEAIKFSKERHCPILVDELDRLTRNVKTLKKVVAEQVEVIDCELGEGRSYVVIMAKAARGEREGELISQNTKRALQKRKEQGVLLGNRTNLDEAQKKGAAATKARAQDQVRELAPIIRELRVGGSTTARAIADGLNLRGTRTSRGEDWNAGNVRRLLERVSELEQARERAEDLTNPVWGSW